MITRRDPGTASIPAHLEHRISTPDGRTLAVAEWGDPDGWPLVALHGGPGGRISYVAAEPDIYARFGARRITFDRAGWGESTRHPGRSVAHNAADIATIADALGIDRFSLTGRSYGGPHSLAAAALLPDRVIRCLTLVCVAPFDAEGLDFFGGMTDGNVHEFQVTLAGETPLRALLEDQRRETIERLTSGRWDWLGDGYEMSEADRARMVKDQQQTADQVLSALAHGTDGWVDDNLAMVRPWGFDLTAIRIPVVLAYGRTDTLIPAAHGDWLARHIPGVEPWVDASSGHFAGPAQIDRDLDWLRPR